MYIKCPNCGYEGKAKRMIKGSLVLEIVLWLLFIIPGLIYSIWRSTSRYHACPRCKYQFVVKVKKKEVLEKVQLDEKTKAKKEGPTLADRLMGQAGEEEHKKNREK